MIFTTKIYHAALLLCSFGRHKLLLSAAIAALEACVINKSLYSHILV